MLIKTKLLLIMLLLSQFTFAVDTLSIKFIYGSKPNKGFENKQSKWFGGLHGGHIGIGSTDDSIFHFLPNNKFHYVKHVNERNSKFVLSKEREFKFIFGNETDSIKILEINVPISETQKKIIDSLHHSYLNTTPYDYAFIGMRCASASYEVLSHIGITRRKKLSRIVSQNFYPKRLRKKLLKMAKRKKWETNLEVGSIKRIWEKD